MAELSDSYQHDAYQHPNTDEIGTPDERASPDIERVAAELGPTDTRIATHLLKRIGENAENPERVTNLLNAIYTLLLEENGVDAERIITELERVRKVAEHNNKDSNKGGRPSKIDAHVRSIGNVLDMDYSKNVELRALETELTEADVREEKLVEELESAKDDLSRASWYKFKNRVRNEYGLDTTDYVDNPSQKPTLFYSVWR